MIAVGKDVVGEGVVFLLDGGDGVAEKVSGDTEVEGFQNGAANEAAKGVTLGFVAGGEALSGEQIGAAKVVANDAHFVGIVVIGFARELFEFFNDGLHEGSFEDVEAAHLGRSKTLEAAAEVDVFMFEFAK